uniref:Uncharacterized protein n=1 Tax=Nelumbo nucifera TaxID=4432 RepID=A0A822Z931_NELNU|nr:TPA_asm: hypothetical protein HUJ06_015396 [Nelumbo nucifera]
MFLGLSWPLADHSIHQSWVCIGHWGRLWIELVDTAILPSYIAEIKQEFEIRSPEGKSPLLLQVALLVKTEIKDAISDHSRVQRMRGI